MAIDKEYIKDSEELLRKYQDKLSKIEASLDKATGSEKKRLLEKSKELKQKYKEAKANLQELKDSAEEGFENIKEASVELLNALKEAFAEYTDMVSTDNIKENIIYAKENVIQFGKDKAFEIEDRVRNNPLATVAIAAGAGLLIGLFLRRSK